MTWTGWWLRRWGWALALAVALALFAPGWWRWYQLRLRVEQLDAEIVWLDQENRRLLDEMQRLQQDPLYLERVARRKLGRTRKGEVVYKIGPAPSDAPPAPSPN